MLDVGCGMLGKEGKPLSKRLLTKVPVSASLARGRSSIQLILPLAMADESQFEVDLDTLFSRETLDRSSPELFPEAIPGVTEFIARNVPSSQEADDSLSKEWSADFDQEDIRIFQGFTALSQSALVEKVKELQNLAYQLGLEESHEMTRGKFLSILESSPEAVNSSPLDHSAAQVKLLNVSLERSVNGNADSLCNSN